RAGRRLRSEPSSPLYFRENLPARSSLDRFGKLSLFKDDLLVLAGIHDDPVTLREGALEDLFGERVFHQSLNRPPQGPAAEVRIVALVGQERLGGFGELQVDIPLLELLDEVAHFDLDDPLEVLF